MLLAFELVLGDLGPLPGGLRGEMLLLDPGVGLGTQSVGLGLGAVPFLLQLPLPGGELLLPALLGLGTLDLGLALSLLAIPAAPDVAPHPDPHDGPAEPEDEDDGGAAEDEAERVRRHLGPEHVEREGVVERGGAEVDHGPAGDRHEDDEQTQDDHSETLSLRWAGRPPRGGERLSVVADAVGDLLPIERGGMRRGRWSLAGQADAGRAARTTSSSATAPALSRGSLPLPHLGDWTHEGQPVAQPQPPRASRVARQPVAERLVRPLGEAGASRVAVVDHDRRQAGVGVERRRDAADVPSVRGRDERQHPDRGVLRRVGRARAPRPRRPPPPRATPVAWSTRPPSSSACGGQVERVGADDLPGRQPPQERRHLAASPGPSRSSPDRARGRAVGARMVNSLTDWACVDQPGSPRTTSRVRALEVEVGDDAGLALVDVDGSGVDLAVGRASSMVPRTRPVRASTMATTSRRRAARCGRPAGPRAPSTSRSAAAAGCRGRRGRRRVRGRSGRTHAASASVSGSSAAAAARCGPSTCGLSGSMTVASTGASKIASGWCTR